MSFLLPSKKVCVGSNLLLVAFLEQMAQLHRVEYGHVSNTENEHFIAEASGARRS